MNSYIKLVPTVLAIIIVIIFAYEILSKNKVQRDARSEFERGYYACVEYHMKYGDYGSAAFRDEAFNWVGLNQDTIGIVKRMACQKANKQMKEDGFPEYFWNGNCEE
jgi:hypothetical protein